MSLKDENELELQNEKLEALGTLGFSKLNITSMESIKERFNLYHPGIVPGDVITVTTLGNVFENYTYIAIIDYGSDSFFSIIKGEDRKMVNIKNISDISIIEINEEIHTIADNIYKERREQEVQELENELKIIELKLKANESNGDVN